MMTLLPVLGQHRVALSGTIKGAKNGEGLNGTTVRIAELPSMGSGANAYGFYTLMVPAGICTLEVSLVGYQTQSR